MEKGGNSEKRFDPTQLDVTGYSLGGQATWVLWSFYGSCLDPWLHAWELDSSARHLPAWTSACKWDFKAFSHEDHWGIAEHRGLNIYGKEVKWSEVTSYIDLRTLGWRKSKSSHGVQFFAMRRLWGSLVGWRQWSEVCISSLPWKDMKDVKVAIPTQNTRVCATGGKNNKKGTQAAKPNGLERWQFSVRISGCMF